MNEAWVDLHCHSRIPGDDGALFPSALLDMVSAKCGPRGVMSITPHNTTVDLSELHRNDIFLIPGSEISCKFRAPNSSEDHVIHIVALGFDKDHPSIQEVFRINQDPPNQHLYYETILKNLRSIGINLGSLDNIQKENPEKKISRMLISETAVRLGFASSTNQFLDLYIGDRGGAQMAHTRDTRQYVTVEQAMNAIIEGSGYAILAHPLSYQLDPADLHFLVQQIKSYGKDKIGIETYYGPYADAQRAFIKTEFARYGLLDSAASDYHSGDYVHRFNCSLCAELLEALGVKGVRCTE